MLQKLWNHIKTLSLIIWKIVQFWRKCAVDEENWALPVVLYCLSMVYKYFSCLGFPTTTKVEAPHGTFYNGPEAIRDIVPTRILLP